MKTKMIFKTGLVLAILVITTGTINAYNGNKRNCVARTTPVQSCINQIPDLSKDQIAKITALEQTHQVTMSELRNERRATTDVKMKEEIRAKMINQRDNHRNEVSALLAPGQQKVYAQLLATPNYKYQQTNGNRGKGNENGKGSNAQSGRRGNGIGNGNGNRSGNGCRR